MQDESKPMISRLRLIILFLKTYLDKDIHEKAQSPYKDAIELHSLWHYLVNHTEIKKGCRNLTLGKFRRAYNIHYGSFAAAITGYIEELEAENKKLKEKDLQCKTNTNQ